MPSLIGLKGERIAALDAADSILKRAENEKRDLSASEQSLISEHITAVKTLNARIAPIEAANTLSGMIIPGSLETGLAPSTRRDFGVPSGHSTLSEAMRSALPEQREELRAFARYVGGDRTALADLRPSGDGGVFIPTMVAGVIARNYASFTPVRNVATIWPTAGGEPTTFPVISDSEPAVILVSAGLTGADDIVSGNAPPTSVTGPLMGAFKFSSQPVFVPRETLTDANLDIMQEMLAALLARIDRTQNLKYTKGAGTTEPTGFLPTATPFSAGAVALDLDVALDLAYSVPALYRPNGVYMASDLTIKYLRKLKTGLSGDKTSLWKDAFEEGNATLGTPAMLHGFPIFVNNDMDSVATDGTFAGVSPLVFGDFKRFVIREAESGTPYVYRYSVPAKDGGAVIAFKRSDSRLIVPTAISKLTV